MDKIHVKYVSTRFTSTTSPFSILKMYDTDSQEHIICKGNFILPEGYEYFIFEGSYIEDPKFGLQFNVQHYTIENNILNVIETLSSPLFMGIGKKAATVIAQELGNDAISLLQANILLINDLPISSKQKNSLQNGLNQLSNTQSHIELLLKNNVSIKTISYLQSYYQEKLNDVLIENPYVLMHDIQHLGFSKVDEIGRILNDDPLNLDRLCALCYTLCSQLLFKTGSTLLLQTQLYDELAKKLEFELSPELFYRILESELRHQRFSIFDEYVTLYRLFEAEMTIVDSVKKINASDYLSLNIDILDIQKYGTKKGLHYDNIQLECIKTALTKHHLIITGGPGTGKTTILDAVIHLLQMQSSNDIALVAPTGRAAKRLSEACDFNAMTIHRFLKWDMHTNVFTYNEENPLFHTCLIIDEMSMVDSILFSALLKALPHLKRIILVGDFDQLPSVGCGNVLRDLIKKSGIETVELERVFRQKEGSSILEFVHNVKTGKYNSGLIDENQLQLIPVSESEILNYVTQLYCDLSNEESDTQILIPKYQGRNGITAFNQNIQNVLFGNSPILFGYHKGDKVIQLKNNNDLNVYNGDIGEITYLDNQKKSLRISFDRQMHTFSFKELEQISLAYAISIHKAQGTEYQVVILPLSKEYNFMYQRNLIYTALSRAKKRVLLVGDEQVLMNAINKQQIVQRITLLYMMLGV